MTDNNWFIAKRFILRIVSGCVFSSIFCFSGCRGKVEQIRPQDRQASFHAGIQALEQNNVVESIRIFQKLISENPEDKENATIYNCMGISYSQLGQREKAVQAFQKSIQVNPGFVYPFYNLGVMILDSGQEDTAIAYLEKAAILDINGTKALEYLGYLFRRRREWKQARRVLNEAFQHAPHSSRIITALAILNLQSGNVEKAMVGFQQALEHDNGYLPAIYNLAVVNRQWLKSNDQALAYFNEYIRLSPEGPFADISRQAVNAINQLASSNHTTILSTNEHGPDPILAGKTGQVVSDIHESRIRVHPPTFDELMNTAGFFEREERKEAAVNTYLRAVHEAERTSELSCQEQALRSAVNACSDNASAHYKVGLYFSEHTKTAEAMSHFKQAMSLSTNWYDAQMALAQEAVKVGELDTAVVSFKLADQSRPDNAEALWMLSQLYDRNLGLTNMAVQCYVRFVRRFPRDYRAGKCRARLKALRKKSF